MQPISWPVEGSGGGSTWNRLEPSGNAQDIVFIVLLKWFRWFHDLAAEHWRACAQAHAHIIESVRLLGTLEPKKYRYL